MNIIRCVVAALLSFCFVSHGRSEDILRETFSRQAANAPLVHTWGDAPSVIETNAVERHAGHNGTSAAHLVARFPSDVRHQLSYWNYRLQPRLPLITHLDTISVRVKTNVRVSLKIAIAPFGFIYHGPSVKPSTQWQTVTLEDAYQELAAWCKTGNQQAENGWISSIIVAVRASAETVADVTIDEIVVNGRPGARDALQNEILARQARRVRVAAISLVWDEGHRTLENTLAALDEVGRCGVDFACLPAECVYQPAEPIPGPASTAIARKAAQYEMYVVGNLRERSDDKTYLTSFLCDPKGEIVGKYRKSHRFPYEDELDLGDELPVFDTDIGAVGLKIGTDHFFPEIDTVLRRRGASLIVWSTAPFPLRDEHLISRTLCGRAAQNRCCYVISRYAGKEGYGGYADRFSWTATWPLGRAQVIRQDGHTIADSGHAGGTAIATIHPSQLIGTSRTGGYKTTGTFALITSPTLPPPAQATASRVIRAAVIECEPNVDRLLEKLDDCGTQGCDIVCLWEYVWYRTDEEVAKYKIRNQERLQKLADAAKRHRMYVVIGGELERGFNESIVFDRQGTEIGRYTKIAQTTSKDSAFYRAGDKVGIFDLDFGRICTKICLDVAYHEIDRCAALHQVDLVLLHTQDAGPYSESIRLRESHRCMDGGYYLLRAAGSGAETDHRSYIMDPWGMILAASQFRMNNRPIVATIDLDNRPRYFEWPEKVRRGGTYPEPVKRGIPTEDRVTMYGRYNRPVAKGDLRAVILKQRRPELYQQ